MKKNIEIKTIYTFVIIIFSIFLVVPIGSIMMKSFADHGSFSFVHYIDILSHAGFLNALKNSFVISSISAIVTTLLAFCIAYAINYTNISMSIKKVIKNITMLPMFLPTITYGFAIIYSFGKQGLWTKLVGHKFIEIYGFNGLLLGYVMYTLPIAFMLINNAMEYIDKKFIIVSELMEDTSLKTFIMTLLRPMFPTLVSAFIQAFFLSFTDFGIPASVGGKYEVVSSVLYAQMLGSLPNFANGSVVAMMMLIPSIVSVTVLHWLEKYNIRYNKISQIELKKNKFRDFLWGMLSIFIDLMIIAIFAVIFIVPFIKGWPYDLTLTFENIVSILKDTSLTRVIWNSLLVAFSTAIVGTVIVYGSALTVARSQLNGKLKKLIDLIAMVTNTIPGMVIGIAYMMIFSGTFIQNTIFIIVICNIIHYFSSPYLMMKNSLLKMNAGYETTAKLMGDSWLKTILRVITPNAVSSLLEVFSYYFINAMVTVSAVVFIAGARTMVMTTKINELQHFAKFNEIFVLSIFILVINLIAKGMISYFMKGKK